MRYPNLINAAGSIWSDPPALICTDNNWKLILRSGKWTLDITGEHRDIGAAIYNEICAFVFPIGLRLSILATAAGCVLYSNAVGAVPIVLNAGLSEPAELMRVEYNAGMMRVSGAEWPQWAPAPSTYAGPWVDVSGIWGPMHVLASLQIGASALTPLQSVAPMWTVSDVLLTDGVLP